MQELLSFIPNQAKINLAIASKPYSNHCQITANNDLLAVNTWYKQFKSPSLDAYKRVGERLLLWCTYIKGLSLGKLTKEDFEDYLRFLQAPPKTWCMKSGYRGAKKHTSNWRPFVKALSHSAFNTEVRIINSLLNYLVQADYLRRNPLKLIKNYSKFSLNLSEHKYSVWSRMLEDDEWQLIQTTINELPATNEQEIYLKLRTQLLFALLYLLGLRINEVATHTWGALQKRANEWWFFVKGKGGKLGHVPVNSQLMQIIKLYRVHLNKPMYPEVHENDYILVSAKTKQPLGPHQLYNIVKEIGCLAANKTEDIIKKQKLTKLSPHWLRHLSASHQDKAGIPATAIKANHRHSSFQTTQIYLHTEDKLRAQEMEKMQLNLMPIKITTETKVANLKIQIKGNNIIGADGIKFFVDTIETNILNGYDWQKDKDPKIIINEYQKSINKEINFNYLITIKDKLQLDLISQQIKTAAEIRLLKCTVSQE